MFNGDRLNDADALHQRRFAHITKDELDILVGRCSNTPSALV
jgi:hypothetical protein